MEQPEPTNSTISISDNKRSGAERWVMVGITGAGGTKRR
jgi:hypothetical protein